MNNPVTGVDVTTFSGIAAATFAIISAIKMLGIWPGVMSPHAAGRLCLAIAMVLTVASKLSGLLIEDVSWVVAILGGLGAAVGAKLIHDGIGNPVQGKDPSS